MELSMLKMEMMLNSSKTVLTLEDFRLFVFSKKIARGIREHLKEDLDIEGSIPERICLP
jgi:hypothetical protein